jgi:hypothetical protein
MKNKEKNPGPHLSLIAEVTDNQSMPDKYITSEAIAICRPDFHRNIRPSPCTEECIGGIVCQLIIPERRTQLTNAFPGVFVRIFYAMRIILW